MIVGSECDTLHLNNGLKLFNWKFLSPNIIKYASKF